MNSTGYFACAFFLCFIALLTVVLGFLNHQPIYGLMWAAGALALAMIAAHASELAFLKECAAKRNYKGFSL